jgi:hypothetical protein
LRSELMKIHFVSFSAGNEQFKMAAKRIYKEAKECKYFDEIHVCDENTSYPILGNFLNSNKYILNNRGFGFWAWKPHLILDVFNKASNGDVICYADSGCQISPVAFEKFKENIFICKRNKSLFYHMPNIQEKNYTKYKLLEYFDSVNDCQLSNSPQIQATYFYIEVCSENLELIKKWAKISKLNFFSLINDSDSYGIDNTFIEHRHDQSILSLLVKKAEIQTYKSEDNFNIKDYYINSPIMLYPIHTLRTRNGNKKHALVFKFSNEKIMQSQNYFIKHMNGLFFIFQMRIKKLKVFGKNIIKSLKNLKINN